MTELVTSDTSDQTIVLVRHGETEWSRSGQHTGTTDLPLTERGRVTALGLRTRLAGRSFDRVLSSPLERAAATCRLAGFDHTAELRDDLVEWDYGAYEGRTTLEIRQDRPGWDLWRDGVPRGEMPADVSRRVDDVIELLVDTCERACNTLIFAHGHILTALVIRWLDLSIIHGRHLRLDTSSISRLGWKREIRVLESWNERITEDT